MHKPYEERAGHPPDFEVTYRLFTADEGGRRTPAFQGIRWDFLYEDFSKEAFMIWPEFLDKNGVLFAEEFEPIEPYGRALMWIVNPALRRTVHQHRIKVGTRGYFMEGLTKVGVCEVTRILGLMSNPVG
ncbi:hypothetical protein ACO2Q8_10185 [Larkinella sp. VNQ87]|uniref:hypothetical protein n=1 Tax=Larkinella sp. VNQ87 TaxID=3400921 RepID=UPI003C0E92D5